MTTEGECRFAHETCLTHPLHRVALCTAAADALRAKVVEAETWDAVLAGHIRRIRELEALLTETRGKAEEVDRTRRNAAAMADTIRRLESLLATRDAQVEAMREALIKFQKTGRGNGHFYDCPGWQSEEWCVWWCKAFRAALSGGREEEKA